MPGEKELSLIKGCLKKGFKYKINNSSKSINFRKNKY